MYNLVISGLLGENSFYWIASYLAILRCEAIVVPFATVATVEDIWAKQNFINCKLFCVNQRSYRRFIDVFKTGIPIIKDEVLNPGIVTQEILVPMRIV